nr:DDB1- and CUL4-associated factor 4-like [Oncorhynchus nerka]
MKKGNWRDRGRDRRRLGYRSDWQKDRTQEQRYGSSEAGPSYRDRTPENRSISDSAASSSSSSSTAPELPGFYFDAEKNRYFRLLPGHNNCNPLTRGLLQEREQEKHRARMITEDERPRKKAPRAGLNSALLLQKRHLGLLPGNSYRYVSLQIKLWDVRVTKPVRKYEGHHNQHAYLPLHVNEAEGLLMAVGQDCYTRLWSLGDGQLLRTIPSPHPAGKDMIPSVVFSSQLGGNRGLPGLLMAVRHDLYYFPYNSDYQERCVVTAAALRGGGGGLAEAAC